MTIEIHQPELEALIQQRLATGAFSDVEAVLLHALKSSSFAKPKSQPRQNFADFIMQSPLRGSGIEIERIKDYTVPLEF